jgi:hypothetical protein
VTMTRDTKQAEQANLDRFAAQRAITIPSAERPSVSAAIDAFLLERLLTYTAAVNGDTPSA